MLYVYMFNVQTKAKKLKLEKSVISIEKRDNYFYFYF